LAKENELITTIKQALPEIPKKKKAEVIKEINEFLDNHGIGILILATFDEQGNADLRLKMVRTHKEHSVKTFKEFFAEFPQIKNDIKEILEEEREHNYKSMVS